MQLWWIREIRSTVYMLAGQINFVGIRPFNDTRMHYRWIGNMAKQFLKISYFLERILTEHIGIKSRSDSKLLIGYECSIRIRSKTWDIVEFLFEK